MNYCLRRKYISVPRMRENLKIQDIMYGPVWVRMNAVKVWVFSEYKPNFNIRESCCCSAHFYQQMLLSFQFSRTCVFFLIF